MGKQVGKQVRLARTNKTIRKTHICNRPGVDK